MTLVVYVLCIHFLMVQRQKWNRKIMINVKTAENSCLQVLKVAACFPGWFVAPGRTYCMDTLLNIVISAYVYKHFEKGAMSVYASK